MAKIWDYAEHSKEVKLCGGIENYNNTKFLQGYQRGYQKGYKKGNHNGIACTCIAIAVGTAISQFVYPYLEKGVAKIKKYFDTTFSTKEDTIQNKSDNEVTNSVDPELTSDNTNNQERN